MAKHGEVPPLLVILNAIAFLLLGIALFVIGILVFIGLGHLALVTGGVFGVLAGAVSVALLLVFLLFGVLSIAVAIGLWTLHPAAWWLAFIFVLLVLVVSLLFLAVLVVIIAIIGLVFLLATAHEYGIGTGKRGKDLFA